MTKEQHDALLKGLTATNNYIGKQGKKMLPVARKANIIVSLLLNPRNFHALSDEELDLLLNTEKGIETKQS